MDYVKTDVQGCMAQVIISRPDARNAFSEQLMTELRDTARQLADIAELSVVVLSADGPFTVGADLNDKDGLLREGSILERRQLMKLGPDMCKAWQDIEAYTVVAIEGYCIGGGSALAAAIDYRVMGRSAHMRLPEVALGMNMSWQTIPRLVAQIGPARTKQYITLSEKIMTEEALAWGLVEEIVEDGDTRKAALNFADRVAALPPLSVKMTKQAVNAAAYALAESNSYMDRDQFLLTTQTDDYREAVSAFSQKRKPKFGEK